MSEYSRFDRALHWLALDREAVRHMAFDIERTLFRPDIEAARRERHVLIAGLARSGSSILLRLLAGGGEFAVQTYRDMPFVLCPSLWQRLSRRLRRKAVLAERAHKDGLEVGFDTVEAFEEVFWLTHSRRDYVQPDHLVPHEVDAGMQDDFAAFVALVVASRPGTRRYLSKNNNNILRLRGIADSLPEARILVPFRDPVQQALSLRRQHLRFLDAQRADPFAARYMTWLGHFEFGGTHRPFRFSPEPGFEPQSTDYWLDLWTRTYAGILETAPQSVVFWDHDRFCAEPDLMASALASDRAAGAGLDGVVLDSIAPVKPREPEEAVDPSVLSASRSVHRRLRTRALGSRG